MINKVSIVIPVFNEASTVLELLEAVKKQELPQQLKKEMVIVESNSTDGSRGIVQGFVEKYKNSESSNVEVQLLLQERPQGKGNAMRLGLQAVTGDIILIQDADLEYDVADYPQLLQPILDGHTEFVLGSRHLSAGHWKIRKFEESPLKSAIMNFGGSFFHSFFNVLFGVTLTDPTTMFKVFKTECIRGVIFESNRFDFDFELMAKLLKLGYTPLEIPVSYKSRGFAAGKKVTFFRDPITWIIAIIKFRFKRIKRMPEIVRKKNQQGLLQNT
jgi:glycosyltransferase involved in cell wall biosynthesis